MSDERTISELKAKVAALRQAVDNLLELATETTKAMQSTLASHRETVARIDAMAGRIITRELLVLNADGGLRAILGDSHAGGVLALIGPDRTATFSAGVNT